MPNASARFPPSLPLAAICGAILGVAPMHAAQAATLLVTDCTDGFDPGTLRNTISVAPDNSIIQIPMKCSTITLAYRVYIPAITNMTIAGQGPSATMIDAGSNDRAFASEHTGTLTIENLTIAHGAYTGPTMPWGGCIYGKGSIDVENALITDCKVLVTTGTANAKGGAIFSNGSITLVRSTVTGNVVTAAPGHNSFGGGLYAANGILSEYSTISDNAAYTVSGAQSFGGGVYSAAHSVVIENSTISGNKADVSAALHVRGSGSLTILSSTITGNVANVAQAIASYMPVFVYNSTIAFNRAASAGSLAPVGLYSNNQIAMYNSIFAVNLSQSGSATDVFSHAASNPLFGSNNLITATNNSVPLGTLSTCPRLGHLSDNGGPTKTIPLLVNSPALDVGADNGQATDQRGIGFPRTLGAGTDIGAYERQPGATDDVVFFGEFDSRCD